MSASSSKLRTLRDDETPGAAIGSEPATPATGAATSSLSTTSVTNTTTAATTATTSTTATSGALSLNGVGADKSARADDYDEEPQLKYQRLGGSVSEILKRDAGTFARAQASWRSVRARQHVGVTVAFAAHSVLLGGACALSGARHAQRHALHSRL